MSFITLNGIALSVLANSSEREDLELGEGLSRAFDGSAQRSVRGYKRLWSMATIPDVPSVSQAFVALLQGRGHHWSFDTDLYSDQGLGPAASGGASSVAGGLFGNALQLAATTGTITYAGLAGKLGCTVLIQRKESGVWHDYHLTWNSVGTLTNVYKDGVAQAVALPSWVGVFSFSSGLIALQNTAGSAQLFDEMVAWPFEAPAAWLSQLATWRATNAWSLGPTFTMGGTLATATVQGKPGKSKLQMAAINGTFYDNAESFPFDLWEV